MINEFLSNFYASPMSICGVQYPTAEHAFQAQKDPSPAFQSAVSLAPTPRAAKALGRSADLRSDWERIKMGVMLVVVRAKFAQNPALAIRLAETEGDIIEQNTWHDQIWGVCVCPEHINTRGNNALGVILMIVRGTL